MSKESDDENDEASRGNKELKGLAAAAAMVAMAGGGECSEEKRKCDNTAQTVAETNAASDATIDNTTSSAPGDGQLKRVSAARVRRLEQNRRAAIESRRRKKVMIEELQRSVTFYTKANDTLKMDNSDLEQRLYLAKQRVMQIGSNAPSVLKSPPEQSRQIQTREPIATLKAPPECQQIRKDTIELKAPPKETNALVGSKRESIPSEFRHTEQRQASVAPVATSTHVSSLGHTSRRIRVHGDRAQAQLAATQAMYETMGYPSTAARVAASTFSQFVGITGDTPRIKDVTRSPINPDANLDARPSASEPIISIAAQLPSEAEVGQENYVEALKKFAMQQAAAANAAAAAASVAIQALNWHKMIKANGLNLPPEVPHSSPALMPPISTSVGSQLPSDEEEEPPPLKKRKS